MEHDDSPIGPLPFEIESLLHPAQAFGHPREVVQDPDLTLNEKRAILASWASDASAVEGAPALRKPPGASGPVTIDDILEALRELDALARSRAASWARRQLRRKTISDMRERRAS